MISYRSALIGTGFRHQLNVNAILRKVADSKQLLSRQPSSTVLPVAIEALSFDSCCDVIDRVDAIDFVQRLLRPLVLLQLLGIVDERVNARRASNAQNERGRSDITYVLEELTAKRHDTRKRNWKETLPAARQWKNWVKMGNDELEITMVLAVSDIPVSWIEKKFTLYQLECFEAIMAQHEGLQALIAKLTLEVRMILTTHRGGEGEHDLITY
jgi:hypothetical protein